MKKLQAAIAAAATGVCMSALGCAHTTDGMAVPSSDTVSPRFDRDPCAMVTADEIAASVGVPGLQPERYFTADDSDSCEWGESDIGLLRISFIADLDDKFEGLDPDADSLRLSEALGRQTVVFHQGVDRCWATVMMSESRILGFEVVPAPSTPIPPKVSPETTCDHFVPLIVTVIERTGWA